MTEQTGTRKPTAAQLRFLNAVIDGHENPQSVVGSFAPINTCREQGWATSRRRSEEDARNVWTITRAGCVAAKRADRFALAEVKVGDLLRYVTHPGCVVRVREVLDGGRAFSATYVSVCGVCEHSLGSGDRNARKEPRHSHLHAQTLEGQPAPGWRTPAYLVEPLPAADAEQVERDILDSLDAHIADRKAHDRGELPLPRPLYADTIRPELLDWPVGLKVGDLTPGQRLVQSRRAGCRLAAELSSPAFAAAVADDGVQQATGAALAAADEPAAECGADLADWPFGACSLAPGHDGEHDRPGPARRREPAAVAPESFHTANGVLDGPAAQAMRDKLLLADVPDELTPRFPAGTAEYERYAAELRAELARWTRGERPYGDDEPETAYGRLSEEYGQAMNDRDDNPSHVGFDQWLAEQVERLRVEVAMRDAGRRAGLGVVDLVRAYGVQLGKGDAAGAAAALSAVQDHVGGLLAAVALAGGEQVAAARDERDRAVMAWRDLGAQLGVIEQRERDRLAGRRSDALPDTEQLDVDEPAPFEVGDRVTWGGVNPDDLSGLLVWRVTRVWQHELGHWCAAATRTGRGTISTAAPAEQFHKLPPMPEQHRVFTFGSAHSHPDAPDGADLGKHFVRVPGDTELARARMFALFGKRWSFDYDPERFEPQVEQYGLCEVALPSSLAVGELADELRRYVHEQIAGAELDVLAARLRYGTDGR